MLYLFAVPIAPMNLTAKTINSRILMVTWTYPSSLIGKITSFKVQLLVCDDLNLFVSKHHFLYMLRYNY